jgi:hypothetical protein
MQDVKLAEEKLSHATDDDAGLPPVRGAAATVDVKKV